MGWSYRRSFRMGPLRINASRSGLGYSMGAGGFRVGVRANGRNYASVNVPGTGLTYRASHEEVQRAGCVVLLVAGGVASSALWWFA